MAKVDTNTIKWQVSVLRNRDPAFLESDALILLYDKSVLVFSEVLFPETPLLLVLPLRVA